MPYLQKEYKFLYKLTIEVTAEVELKYILVTGGNAAELSENVNKYLNEGYEVYGSPFNTAGLRTVMTGFAQAVIKSQGK